MPNGFSLGVLQFMKEVTKNATPQYKVDPYGFLASLMLAHSPGVIKNDSYNGHKKTVKVRKKKRFTVSQTTQTPSCDVTNTNPATEDEVSVAGFRQIAFHIPDETIAAYDEFASGKINIASANPGLVLMYEFADDLMSAANAILSGVNQDLVALAAASFGVNKNTGSNAVRTLNINKDANVMSLTDGPTQLIKDFKDNNMSGRPVVVGAGNAHAWFLQQAAKTGTANNGLDTRIQAAMMDFFYDNDMETALGDNQFGVYEKDAVQLVEYLKYQGFKAGQKPGASTFGVLPLPMAVTAGNTEQLVPVKFDFQLKYNECAEEFASVDGSDDPVTLEKGYNLIVSKNFGLYTIATTAYRSDDELYGNRGSLRYEFTNDCDPCDSVDGY